MIIYTLKKTTSAFLLLGGLCLVVAGCGTGDGDIVNDIDECSIHSHTMSQRANEEIDETLHHTPAEYTVRLLVGDQDIDFVADTGSSNLVIQGDENLCENCTGPENERYHPAESSIGPVGEPFSITYGSGSATFAEYQDVVGLECGDPIDGYTFGVITTNDALPNILGLAYQSLAQGTPPPGTDTQTQRLPPFFDQLVEQHGLDNEFSMLLCGHATGSRIVLGGRDERRADDGSYRWVPIIEESYYVVEARSFQIKGGGTFSGTESTIAFPSSHQTIIDSGTTMNLLPGEMVTAIIALMKQTVQDNNITDIPDAFWTTTDPSDENYSRKIPAAEVVLFPTLQVVLRDGDGQDAAFDISPTTYFKAMYKDADEHVFGFRAATGSPYILGQVFMENGLYVFDRANKRIGIAPNTGFCGTT